MRLEQARALKALCRRRGAALIVNDHVELALEVGADGVHLGGEDGSCAQRARQLGAAQADRHLLLRRIALAREAERAGADYVAFGSFFPSAVKPGAVRAPLELLRAGQRELARADRRDRRHHERQRGEPDRKRARTRVAVISAVFDAPDVAAAAARVRRIVRVETS